MGRSVRVHCFFSVKGGVGKSTLALALAQLLSRPERCVVLDLDLTGSSLSEGLSLQAPEIAVRGDGSMDLDAPPTGSYLGVDGSRAARDARKRAAPGLWLPPPYMNDALRYEGND
jgi:cellulose biosynthesis protein BcsQ